MVKFDVLKKHISSARFGLTLDIGHAFCTETIPFRQVYGKSANLIRNIHIEDIRDRKHEHLMFGEGQLDFVAILRVLSDNKYTGLINVELTRDSHRATEVARASIEFLNATCQKLMPPVSSSPVKPTPSATR
jgi:sugar phosphate isomerase/epimerase